MLSNLLHFSSEVSRSLELGVPVVALESTLIAHGLPWPTNLETALECEFVIRQAGAIPATIAIWHGTPAIGLSELQIRELAQARNVRKASRRDLGEAIALGQLAATTVSATMALAELGGIRVFATGGIGGAHPRIMNQPWDISADLSELARTRVLVVCSGAKSILDLPQTLELLETLGVPVMGYETDEFPRFFVKNHQNQEPFLPVSIRIDSASEAARIFNAHTQLGGGGAILAQLCPHDVALDPDELELATAAAIQDAVSQAITGPKLTPFLLAKIMECTNGQSLIANRALIVNNARLAARVAIELQQLRVN